MVVAIFRLLPEDLLCCLETGQRSIVVMVFDREHRQEHMGLRETEFAGFHEEFSTLFLVRFAAYTVAG